LFVTHVFQMLFVAGLTIAVALVVVCKCRWLDKGKGDGAIELDLTPTITDGVNWRLMIATGT
jgi:hypothetical protein